MNSKLNSVTAQERADVANTERIKISVITVSYNSEATLRRTMESVLNQTYAPYEYIIIDGASTDGTLEIISSMENAFKIRGINLLISSEKDNGIYDAMNKGIDKASGDLIGIINSDDWYETDALKVVAQTYAKSPFDLFWADLRMHMPNGTTFIKRARNRKHATSRDWNHPTTFIARDIYKEYHYRTKTLHDDYDLILKLKKAQVRSVVKNVTIANFTMNGVSHERNLRAALKRCGIKYSIYRDNGYSPLYFLECFAEEMGKLIIG